VNKNRNDVDVNNIRKTLWFDPSFTIPECVEALNAEGITIEKYIQHIQIPDEETILAINNILKSGDGKDFMIRSLRNMLVEHDVNKYNWSTEIRKLSAHRIFVFLIRFGCPLLKYSEKFRNVVYDKLMSDEFQTILDSQRYVECLNNVQEYNYAIYDFNGDFIKY